MSKLNMLRNGGFEFSDEALGFVYHGFETPGKTIWQPNKESICLLIAML